MKKAALTIQRYYRAFKEMHHCRSFYLQLKASVSVIETRWIARCAVIEQRNKYLQIKGAAIKIQSALRGHIARKKFLKKKRAALTIQRFYWAFKEMRRCRSFYLQLKASVKIIEIRWIARCTGSEMRAMFLKMKYSAVKIQAAYRGYLCRKHIIDLQKAAVIIQTATRSYLVRKSFLQRKNAALVIQAYYRSYREMCHCYQQFNTMKVGFIALQALWRGKKARKDIKKLNERAVVIQSYFRCYSARKHFVQLQTSAIVIQRSFRAQSLMKKHLKIYLLMKRSAVVIQSAYRRHLAQKYMKRVRAAIKIQSYWRMWFCHKQFLQQKCATIKIQSFCRMVLQRRRYCCKLKNAICIQRRYREYLVLKFCRQVYINKRKSCILIQSFFRMYQLRKTYLLKQKSAIKIQAFIRMAICRASYLKYQQAARVIQQYYRSVTEGRQQKLNYQIMRRSTIIIQAFYRGYVARKAVKRLKSAILIQSHVRAYLTRKSYIVKKQAAVTVQSAIRCFIARKNYRRTCKSIITIQRAYRNKLVARKQREKFLRIKKACILLQSWIRCVLTQKLYREKHRRVVLVQSVVRMKLASKRYSRMLTSVVSMQRRYRAKLLMRKLQMEYREKRTACITIQAWYRGAVQRCKYNDTLNKIVIVQAFVRGFIARKAYERNKEKIIKFQRLWKKTLMLRREMQKREQAAVIIQKYYRGYCQRQWYLTQLHLICLLQRCARRVLAQRRFSALKQRHQAAITIQCFWRCILARKCLRVLQENRNVTLLQIAHVAALHLYAIRIQRCFRLYVAVKRGEKQLSAIIKIQSWFRIKQQRLWFLRLRSSIIEFQKSARSYLKWKEQCAIKIQACIRSWLVRRKLQKMHNAATKIQSIWRAFKIRSSMGKEVDLMREKVQSATSRATEDQTLKFRTTSAIEILLYHNTNVSFVLRALKNIDVATRSSPICCEEIAFSGGAEAVLHIVVNCNRSLPHIEMIKLCANILLNLCKYHKTVGYVWAMPEFVNGIFGIVKIFRQKEPAIFTKCLSVLWILSQDPKKAEVLRNEFQNEIRSLHYVVTRKKKMETKRKETLARVKDCHSHLHLTSSINISSLPVEEPKKQLPIEPDWVLGKQVRREFDDPVVAINAVMKQLRLKPK